MSDNTKSYFLPTVILGTRLLDTPVVNTDEFCAFFDRQSLNSDVTIRQLVVPRGMTIHSLTVEHTNAQAVTVQVISLVVNGTTSTALTLDVPIAVAGFTQDLVNRVHVDAGDLIALKFASEAGATNAQVRCYSFLGDLDG